MRRTTHFHQSIRSFLPLIAHARTHSLLLLTPLERRPFKLARAAACRQTPRRGNLVLPTRRRYTTLTHGKRQQLLTISHQIKRSLAQSPSCDCGQRQTINHTVDGGPHFQYRNPNPGISGLKTGLELPNYSNTHGRCGLHHYIYVSFFHSFSLQV